jgi:hypothetical protein
MGGKYKRLQEVGNGDGDGDVCGEQSLHTEIPFFFALPCVLCLARLLFSSPAKAGVVLERRK